MKQSNQQGMITFDQALFNLYTEGEISYNDALRYADSSNEVRLMIKLDQGDMETCTLAYHNVTGLTAENH